MLWAEYMHRIGLIKQARELEDIASQIHDRNGS
jgi:hypothetical protein